MACILGSARVDLERRQVDRNGRRERLTELEAEVLRYLVEADRPVSRDELLERVWGYAPSVFSRACDTTIRRLRAKVEEDPAAPAVILTVHGFGYRVVSQTPPPAPVRGTDLPTRRLALGASGRFLDLDRLRIETPDGPVALTATESALLEALIGANGGALDRETLARRLWGTDRRKPLEAAVYRLRRKLELDPIHPRHLLTTSRGYRIELPEVDEAPARPRPTVAVLPLRSLGDGSDDGYLELGMADALITKLGRTGRLAVRPTSAVRRYAGRDHDTRAVGRELGADAVLEGTVQRAGDRLRVSIQLIRVRDGTTLWSDRYDGSFTDVFEVQDAVSEQVADALAGRLSALEVASLRERETSDASAYERFMRGTFFWNRRHAEAFPRAIAYFEQALALDPTYARAHAGLAASLSAMSYLGYGPPAELRPKMQAAARRAVALDPESAEAHVVMGTVLAFHERRWEEGEREFVRALELDPELALAHHWRARFLEFNGRYAQALAARRQAHRIDPVTPIYGAAVGQTLDLLGDDDAIGWFERALELDETLDQAWIGIGHVHERHGEDDLALAAFRRAVDHGPKSRLAKAALGHAMGRAGQTDEARALLADLDSTDPPASPFHLAIVHAGLADEEAALACLERGCEEGDANVCGVRMEPQLRSLRGHPRVAALVERLGLAPTDG